jgi:hypothetical protein
VEQRIRSGAEMAFLLYGLEFARVRVSASDESFNRVQQLTFGAGANETELTPDTEDALMELIARLFERRTARGDKRDPLYRMQPERWLESMLRQDVAVIDAKLDPQHVYTQVPAFAAADRGMLDLLSISEDGRLAVIELKADEDLQLALQGLDYWIRVRWHHLQSPDYATGLGEFQRHGYFGGMVLSPEAPRLYLVAPRLCCGTSVHGWTGSWWGWMNAGAASRKRSGASAAGRSSMSSKPGVSLSGVCASHRRRRHNYGE